MWAISETWNNLRRSIPLWATQGLRHQRQEIAWAKSAATRDAGESGTPELAPFRENEAFTIQQRYAPCQQVERTTCLGPEAMDEPDLASREKEILSIRTRCLEHGVLALEASALQDEQERELSPELITERERQCEIERPKPAKPAGHSLHVDVGSFIITGLLPEHCTTPSPQKTPGIIPATPALEKSTIRASVSRTSSVPQSLGHYGLCQNSPGGEG